MDKSKHNSDPSIAVGQMASLKHWGSPPESVTDILDREAIVDCGWGRLIFGQTFDSSSRLAETLLEEKPGQRDVVLYPRDPQVIISRAPQALFIDPSLTFRLDLADAALDEPAAAGLTIRPAVPGDLAAINRLYKSRGMVKLREHFPGAGDENPAFRILVALDDRQGSVVGCVNGVDHHLAFEDPDNGASLWALAVDSQCRQSGVGKALVLELARGFRAAGRAFMDLSVMHDNAEAIQLYQSLGFYQIPVYCVKNKNTINEELYVGNRPSDNLNVYAQIIVDEAYRRGIAVDVIDGSENLFDLSLGGRSISCRESLSDLTSAVALSRCSDKAVTHKLLRRAGLNVPEQELLTDPEHALDFLERHRRIVIKPAEGEQGHGVFVDLREPEDVSRAYSSAAGICDKVIGEAFIDGQDLRIVVIDEAVVAAAVRVPASIVGDGVHCVADLIAKQSRRRKAATQGESEIPVDDETLRCIEDAGYGLDDVPEQGVEIQVRKTANLHTGGCLHDVTDELNPLLADAAIRGARALDIPVVGFDLIVRDPAQSDYVIIEANERPGLANHEPQPTAERFIDMLFPQTVNMKGKPHASA